MKASVAEFPVLIYLTIIVNVDANSFKEASSTDF